MRLDPRSNSEINIKLFKNVKNAGEIKQKILKGDLKCCAINPTLIYSTFHIIVAANKTLLQDKFTTNSVFSEILFNLSTTKNISKSLRTFGIQDNDHTLMMVTVNELDKDEVSVREHVDGDEADLSELETFRDITAIKKIYKISEKEAAGVTSLEDSIVSRITTKNFLSL